MGCVGWGVACRDVQAESDVPFHSGLWDAGILGRGRVRRGVSFADSSTLIRFSEPGLGSQTSEEKILAFDNSHLPVLGIRSKASHVLSKSSTTELHPTALFLLSF